MLHPVALIGVLLVSTLSIGNPHVDQKSRPQVAEEAPDFQLKTLAGKQVTLTDLRSKGPVVIVVLRGFPGYQCPLCTRQVGSLLKSAQAFSESNANVVFVYPGPASVLNQKAKEFLRGSTLPQPFQLVTDPDYKFTNLYGLRWDAPRETAYPSTFVIGKDGKVTFAVVSKSHGGRTSADDVVKAVRSLK